MTVSQIKLLTQEQLKLLVLRDQKRTPSLANRMGVTYPYHEAIERPGAPFRSGVGYTPRDISGDQPVYVLMGLSLKMCRPVQMRKVEEHYLIQAFEPFGGLPHSQDRYGGELHLRYREFHGWLFQAVCCMTLRGVYIPV